MTPTDITLTLTPEILRNLAGLSSERELAGLSPEIFAVPARQLRTMSLADRTTFHIIYARHLYVRGEYHRALARAKCAMRLSRGGSDHALFARAKHVCGIVCNRLGRIDEAAEQFLEAFVTYKRARKYDKVCLPLASLGLMRLYAGDLEQARKTLSDALAYATMYCGTNKIADCVYNLFIANMLSGNFAECRTALNWLLSQPLLVLDSALCARYEGQLRVWHLDTHESRDLLKRAMVVFARERFQRDYYICLEYLGMNEYFAGNYAKAKEYYQQVLAMPEPTASAVAQTLRMLTDVYVAEKDWKNAKETAIKAEIAITKINERIELAALWRAQAQIAEHECDQSAARALFQKSIDLLQQCGARYELALTHFAAGQSIVYSTAARLEYLQQAKALFVEMDVPKQVALVDAAIGRIGSKLVILAIAGKSKRASRAIITLNPEMRMILNQIEHTKDSDMTVLITGETGTGKDLLAEYIHYASKRAKGPFVNENSAAFSETLIEAELFGYNRGAFSGAVENKPGLIESAAGGTFCFNEIAEIPTSLQAKLLKLLETKTVRRLGDVKDREIDVRFIAMTNRKLAEMVKQGGFREDLFHRMQQMTFHLPPLRERIEDISPLFEYFLGLCGISPTQIETAVYEEMLTHLRAHHWQGNVRELSNFAGHLANLNGDFNSASILAMAAKLKSRRR